MQIHNLKRNKANRKAKQVGRGGTRGKTSGRGTKGQNARAGHKKRPEMRDFIKKLPKLRGRGKNFLKSRLEKPIVLNVNILEKIFAKGDTINAQMLLGKGLVTKRNGRMPKVKILGVGPLTKSLNIEKLAVSKSAKEMIELAGGKVI